MLSENTLLGKNITKGKEGYSIRIKITLSKKYMAILNLFVYDTIALKLTSSADKESTSNAGDHGSIPGLGRSPGERIGYLLQYSWASMVAQLVKNPPAMRETWIRSLGGEDPRRRAWQPTPVLLPGEPHGQRSLVGYSPQGREESDTTE